MEQINEQLHGTRYPSATSEATGQFGTGSIIRQKTLPFGRHKSIQERFLDWLIGWLLPGFHLAKNPPKGYKRPRKVKGGTEHGTE